MGRAFEFRKARKMKRWSKMAKTFTRIGKDIVMVLAFFRLAKHMWIEILNFATNLAKYTE